MTTTPLLTQAISVFGPKLFARLSQSEMCEALGLLDQKTVAAKLGKRAYYTNDQAHALENRQAQLNTSGDHLHGKPQ